MKQFEHAVSFGGVFAGKKALITGHTGFKGAWLSEWLVALGAEVTGLALPPPTRPSLFEQLELANRITHKEGDVRDPNLLTELLEYVDPDFIFHLAAQPLVRHSYVDPIETYTTNTMGTAYLLDAARLQKWRRPCIIVAVTTDKCYENKEWLHSYREEDAMGGYDPYSSSKGAAELIISSYRRSYFSTAGCLVKLASARAGNVVGGGDWAADRIVPDCVRALSVGKAIPVRNKASTRPWQHVLEPLSGYLWLAACLSQPTFSRGLALSGSFNFGPPLSSNRNVAEVVQEMLKHWPGTWEDRSDPAAPHEANLLNLATDKAYHCLGWGPVWSFQKTVQMTADWYRRAQFGNEDVLKLTASQIAEYTADAQRVGLAWACR